MVRGRSKCSGSDGTEGDGVEALTAGIRNWDGLLNPP